MKKILIALLLLPTMAFAQQQPPVQAPTINQSVTIATGNTFQTIAPAAGRRSLTIQNNNATDSCWITFGTLNGTKITTGNAAKASSILLLAGGSYTRYAPYTPTDEIEGTCASNSDTFYVDIQ